MKLHIYGFNMASIILIYTYLCGRKRKVEVKDKYSSWEKVLFGFSKGSILWQLLFNVIICDLFLFENNIDNASYADDNTPYAVSSIQLWRNYSNNLLA